MVLSANGYIIIEPKSTEEFVSMIKDQESLQFDIYKDEQLQESWTIEDFGVSSVETTRVWLKYKNAFLKENHD